jgi:signal transduction histidine kinase/HAMP domain-containing protein
MNYLKRFLLLFAATAALSVWALGLDGTPAWLFRGFVVLAFGALATYWAVSPWREMRRAARRVQEEDYSARLDDVTPGDLREAAGAFNAMAERLAELKRLSQEREGRFNAILSASERAVLLMDREGKILLSSPATPKLFPRFREDAMLAPLGLPGLSQLVEESIEKREGRTATLSESEAGRGRVFDVRTVPLEDGSTVVILDEMTTQARLDKVKADLVANVSHELRTPLAAMAALLETLEARDLTADQRTHFEARLRSQHGRMQALVEDLLSLSRLEGRQVTVRPESVELGSLVQELFASIAPLAAAAQVSLQAEIPAGLRAQTDRNLLEMALKNLVDNGIRYNRKEGSVTVRADAANGELLLDVTDTGEGIPAPHLDRIFERFYRVEPHRSREKGGTGLGLSIVKHTVMQLGGQISVQSAVGSGTRFRIRLPHVEPAPHSAAG